jgi:hypothetical protein
VTWDPAGPAPGRHRLHNHREIAVLGVVTVVGAGAMFAGVAIMVGFLLADWDLSRRVTLTAAATFIVAIGTAVAAAARQRAIDRGVADTTARP